MRTLYCLECGPGRFYVGQTPQGRFQARLREHKHSNGAKWTTAHKPTGVLWTRRVGEDEVEAAEDRACCMVMRLHGLNSCRGGLFNIGRDVREMPGWAQPIYKRFETEILAASS